jgi:hypothetical protein
MDKKTLQRYETVLERIETINPILIKFILSMIVEAYKIGKSDGIYLLKRI